MKSFNVAINELHAAFCSVSQQELEMTSAMERWWFNALQDGVTAEMVRLVYLNRVKRQYQSASQRDYCLGIAYFIKTDENVAELVSEFATIKAKARKKTFPADKASVLRDTGRPHEPDQAPARHVSEIFKAL